MAWIYASASVRGLSHIRSSTRLQDAKQCFEVNWRGDEGALVAIVADGAGSAEFGGQGASIACRTIGSGARTALSADQRLPDDDLIWWWVDQIRDRIHIAADRREIASREFATTLVMFIATPAEVLTAHIGDGAVVGRDRLTSTWSCLSAPQNGEYASTTFFVTDSPAPALRISRYINEFDAIASFSDGIENLVLDRICGTPSSAFFDPIARPLEKTAEIGHSPELSKSLAQFLGSERLNERTDDDKTLIVALSR